MNPAITRIEAVIDSPSFSADIMPVLRQTCGSSGGCHGGLAPQKGLNLEVDSLAYASMVNVASVYRPSMMRVRPGKPDSSFLYRVLNDTASVRFNYYRMPLTEYPLPRETRVTIGNWILKGALRN